MKHKYKCKMCGAKSPIYTKQKSMLRHVFSHNPSISIEEGSKKIHEYFEEVENTPTSPNINCYLSYANAKQPKKRRSKRAERIRQLEQEKLEEIVNGPLSQRMQEIQREAQRLAEPENFTKIYFVENLGNGRKRRTRGVK